MCARRHGSFSHDGFKQDTMCQIAHRNFMFTLYIIYALFMSLCGCDIYKAGSRLASSQWESVLLCNDVSHWLAASLESALYILSILSRPAQSPRPQELSVWFRWYTEHIHFDICIGQLNWVTFNVLKEYCILSLYLYIRCIVVCYLNGIVLPLITAWCHRVAERNQPLQCHLHIGRYMLTGIDPINACCIYTTEACDSSPAG